MTHFALLGDAIRARAGELGLGTTALAEAAGVDQKTIRNLGHGTRPSVKTMAALERALGWRPGDIGKFLAGELPAPRTVEKVLVTEGGQQAIVIKVKTDGREIEVVLPVGTPGSEVALIAERLGSPDGTTV